MRESLSRRGLMLAGGGAALAAALPKTAGARGAMITRPIPSSGERIPAVGMGTWITFNVGGNERLRRERMKVLETFFARGGGLVDSSPMYGSAQEVMGWCLERLPETERLISATKVWTRLSGSAEEQMADARDLWGLPSFDVMQVHNLVEWQPHLKTLRRARDAGLIRYIGVTTSHGSRHDTLERIMRTEPLDFVQFTYNIEDRWAEERLLPLAADQGIAVIVNRPFKHKRLFDRYQDDPLPPWCADFDCENWAQFFLKFVLGHPAVTCAIPATAQVAHMEENMGALYGRLPDTRQRQRMVDYIESL